MPTASIENLDPISRDPCIRLELESYLVAVKKDSRRNQATHIFKTPFKPISFGEGINSVNTLKGRPSPFIDMEAEKKELQDLVTHF